MFSCGEVRGVHLTIARAGQAVSRLFRPDGASMGLHGLDAATQPDGLDDELSAFHARGMEIIRGGMDGLSPDQVERL